MSKKWRILSFAVLSGLMMGTFLGDVEAVLAADEGAGGDDYMQQKGLDGLFSAGMNKKKDPRAPKGWQVALGLGAIPVTIIALKRL